MTEDWEKVQQLFVSSVYISWPKTQREIIMSILIVV